jgi:hypothetical protein
MKYEVFWSTSKVVSRSEIVMKFWDKIASEAKEKLGQLPTADKEDKGHLGQSARLRRLIDAANGQKWRAEILLTEAKDLPVDGGRWTWNNEDLLWFYPELATADDNLLQLGK